MRPGQNGPINKLIFMFEIYKNKKVFITGHTGFKGSWLSFWLKTLGAEVTGYSLEPNSEFSMFKELNLDKFIDNSVTGNILDVYKLEKTISEFKPDIVFHLAAQPLVRLSYIEPLLTYQTNVIGTLNLFEASRKAGTKAFINVTTDKCYENKEIKKGYVEDDSMGGFDMYSSSKGCVEIMTSSYRRSFLNCDNSMLLSSVRAGNVIGGGDWAIDRLIPDCIRAINDNKKIVLRNPFSIRPWQFVLEPLSGYLLLGTKLLAGEKNLAQGFNFGPNEGNVLSVKDVVDSVIQKYGKGEIEIKKDDKFHEANLLMLNIDKAKKLLGWKPVYDAQTAIEKTVEWYVHFYKKDLDIFDFTYRQIKEFKESIKWMKTCAIK